MAARARVECPGCGQFFIPPTVKRMRDWERAHCPSCRRVMSEKLDGRVVSHKEAIDLRPPIKQAVLDIETFSLDRGWGVMLMADVLVHEGGPRPTHHVFKLRDYSPWKKGIRSDDSELARDVIDVLKPCHIVYAHNGDFFDIRWLRSLGLKYGLDWHEKKLVDPAKVARQKYAIGRNSLSALADFLELPEEKMHVPMDVWRKALMDDNEACWKILEERCASDVRLLNAVANRVIGSVDRIDTRGSAF